jgi:hypothetical protein
VCVCGVEDWTEGSAHAQQALFLWSILPAATELIFFVVLWAYFKIVIFKLCSILDIFSLFNIAASLLHRVIEVCLYQG